MNIDKKADIYVIDPVDHNLSAEDTCKLGALYSRSRTPARDHIAKIKETGSSNFMNKWYLGYGGADGSGKPGHGSIGQMGTTNIALEGISVLAAKAVEDHPLFKGQENSTRYLEFKNNGHVIPTSLGLQGADIVSRWMALYVKVKDAVTIELNELNTKPDDISDGQWKNTIKAAAFDVASGYLPCTIKTNVFWHTDLDNFNNHAKTMAHYPLQEVRELALTAKNAMSKRYPSSIIMEYSEDHTTYLNYFTVANTYSELSIAVVNTRDSGFSSNVESESRMDISADISITQITEEMMTQRPKYMPVPKALKSAGMIKVLGCLDFASFRDLQRHRDGHIPMPLIHADNGFHSWYLNELPKSIRLEVGFEVEKLLAEIAELQNEKDEGGHTFNMYEGQYLNPMGIRVPVELNWAMPQYVYCCELRTSQTCREPLRRFMQKLSKAMTDSFPWVIMYSDMSENELSTKRGAQDIVDANGKSISEYDENGDGGTEEPGPFVPPEPPTGMDDERNTVTDLPDESLTSTSEGIVIEGRGVFEGVSYIDESPYSEDLQKAHEDSCQATSDLETEPDGTEEPDPFVPPTDMAAYDIY